MAAQNLELRRKVSDSFDHADSLIYVKTHIDQVDGLLNGETINLNLLPSAILETKKLVGVMTSVNKALASCYTDIVNFHKVGASEHPLLYPGSYLISQGTTNITASTGHTILFGDDGLGNLSSDTLENGDHLYYIQSGGTFITWNETQTDLRPTVQGSYVFATKEELSNNKPLSGGIKAIVTGYRWVRVSQSDYDSAEHKMDKGDGTIDGGAVEDMNSEEIPQLILWQTFANGVVRFNVLGGYDYYKLEEVLDSGYASGTQGVLMYNSVSETKQHVWGVINNTYNLVSETAQGLMTPKMYTKLLSIEEGSNKYTHYSNDAFSSSPTTTETIKKIEVNSEGHVTAIEKQDIEKGTTAKTGIVRLASVSEVKIASVNLSEGIASTPKSTHEQIDYWNPLDVYLSTEKDVAKNRHPNGAIAFFVS